MVYNYGTEQINIYNCYDAPIEKFKSKAYKKSRYDKIGTYEKVCAFDIETTAYFDKAGIEKRAMYQWQMSVDNLFCVFGRTLEEFGILLDRLIEYADKAKLTILVQNLTYETQFIIQYLQEHIGQPKVFLLNTRKVQSIEVKNIRFVDTAVMSGVSLQKLCEDYNLHYKKQSGDLDYDKLFNIKSELTNEEVGYGVMDVYPLVEWWYLMQKQRGYTTAQMPITRTGFVRTPLRYQLQKSKIFGNSYTTWLKGIQNTYDTFRDLEMFFQGGITGCNYGIVGQIIEGDIRCRDYTSSYPYVMTNPMYYYPISRFNEYGDIVTSVDWKYFKKSLDEKCCLFEVCFYNLKLKTDFPMPFISSSRCLHTENEKLANGKIVIADVVLKITNDIEFKDILKYYTFDDVQIRRLKTAKRGKLPKVIREYVEKLFIEKTQLKDIDGKELEYLLSKGDLNSIFGMMATNALKMEIPYDFAELCGKESVLKEADAKEKYMKVMKSKKTFLNFAWGCYVTSWARHNLLRSIKIANMNGTFLYCDTDSVYYISSPEIEKAFEEFNLIMTKGSISATNEKTGKTSTLGEMTPDGIYTKFLAFGAKKYFCVKPNGKIKATVAGVPKRNKSTGEDINSWVKSIEDIHIGMCFSGKQTGKLRPDYQVEPLHYADVNGCKTLVAGYINLVPTDYNLSNSLFDEFEKIAI